MTENKDPVQEYIQQIATQGDQHGDQRVAEPFQKLLAEAEKQKRQNG